MLKSLHGELNAAVLQAYAWADLTLPADTDTLLVWLVEMNATRAAEAAAGTVRWLRPEFRPPGQGERAALETGAEAEGAFASKRCHVVRSLGVHRLASTSSSVGLSST